MRKYILYIIISLFSLGTAQAQGDRQEDVYTTEGRFSITVIGRPAFSDRIFPGQTAKLNNASSMPAFGVDLGALLGIRISYRSRLQAGFFGTNRLYSITSRAFDNAGQSYTIIRKYHWSYNQIQTNYNFIFLGTTKNTFYLNLGIGHNILQRLQISNTEIPAPLTERFPPENLSHDGLRNAGFNMYVPALIVGAGIEHIFGGHFFLGFEPSFQIMLGSVGPGQYDHSIYAIGGQARVGYQFNLGGN